MVWRWGKRESIYLSLYCHHQNDSCIKMGSDESHFNVSLIVRDKVTTRLCPQTTTFLMKKESRSGIEPRPLCFKPAHKPSCRPPLVIPPDNSGKGAGLWMGADGSSGPASCTITLVEYRDAKTRGVVHRRNGPRASHQT